MNDAVKLNLLAATSLILLTVLLWGGLQLWSACAVVTAQLLIVAVQTGIYRSGKVRS